ncbi:MAG: CcdB family protein [Pseudomonadota bacterium]|nr:CcdB family protein [Pseudomonadota bacterium]
MSQFDVYRNPNPGTRAGVPLLLDVQHDLLADLSTRLVVPLCPVDAMRDTRVKTLMPIFEVDGVRYLMLTPQLAGISRKQAGNVVGNLAAHRGEIMAALDLLLTGI